MIHQIARFLAEFSTLSKPNPHMRRLGINISALDAFGINIEDHFNHIEEGGKDDEDDPTGNKPTTGTNTLSY